jgi:hypothetical protein
MLTVNCSHHFCRGSDQLNHAAQISGVNGGRAALLHITTAEGNASASIWELVQKLHKIAEDNR